MEITAKNLKGTILEVELYVEDNKPCVFISHEGSTGCGYELTSTEQLGEVVAEYVEDVISQDEV